MSYLLCFGFGYSAYSLANRLQPHNFRIVGTTQSEKHKTVLNTDVSMVRFNRRHPLDPMLFDDVTHVLISIPPDETGDSVIATHGADLVRAGPTWIGYLSTTGVYGNTDGAWVDETTPPNPSFSRTIARAAAEQMWLNLCAQYNLPVHLFRVAGIYGPGRSAVDALHRGQAHQIITKPGQVLSRIHVEDLTTVLEASMARPNSGAIYNVCDDEPTSSQDVMIYAAALLKREPPPELTWKEAQQTLSPKALSFYTDNRRVCNKRIKRDLSVILRYPSYREGLVHCISHLTGY